MSRSLSSFSGSGRTSGSRRSSFRSLERQRQKQKQNSNPYSLAQGISAHSYGLAVDLRLSVPGLSVTSSSEPLAGRSSA